MSIAETLLSVPKYIVNRLSELLFEIEQTAEEQAAEAQAFDQEENKKFLIGHNLYSEENLVELNELEDKTKKLIKSLIISFGADQECFDYLIELTRSEDYKDLLAIRKEFSFSESTIFRILGPMTVDGLQGLIDICNEGGVEKYVNEECSRGMHSVKFQSKVEAITFYCLMQRKDFKVVSRVALRLVTQVIMLLPDHKSVDAFLKTGEDIAVVTEVAEALLALARFKKEIAINNINAVIAAGENAERNAIDAVSYLENIDRNISYYRSLMLSISALLITLMPLYFFTSLASALLVALTPLAFIGIFSQLFISNRVRNVVPLIINPPEEKEEKISFTKQLGQQSAHYSPMGYTAYLVSYLNPRAYLTNEHNEGLAQEIKKNLEKKRI